jgi:hypothetical protein
LYCNLLISYGARGATKCFDGWHEEEAAVKVVGRISGTSFDAIETAAADLRLEGDAVVLPDPASRAPGHLRIEASVPGI